MSSHGGITLVIRSIALLIKAITELNLAVQEMKQIKTADGRVYSVDLVVKDENNRSIGFQKQADGTYKVIADSSGLSARQLKQQQRFINRIKQRYAYDTVLQELKKHGYQVTEEKKIQEDTVKLTARRWQS